MKATLESVLMQVAQDIESNPDMNKNEKCTLLARLEEISIRNAQYIEVTKRFNIHGDLSDFVEYLMTRTLAAEHALFEYRNGMRK